MTDDRKIKIAFTILTCLFALLIIFHISSIFISLDKTWIRIGTIIGLLCQFLLYSILNRYGLKWRVEKNNKFLIFGFCARIGSIGWLITYIIGPLFRY